MIELCEIEMQHDNDACGVSEKSNKKAFLLDNDDLIKSLGFNAFRRVDYVKIVGNKVYLIEFTDLTNEIKFCIENTLVRDTQSNDISKFIKDMNTNLKIINQKLWFETVEEFKRKFISSIACYERFLRLNNRNDEFQYSLMIVLKNNTSAKDFVFLENHLASKLKNLTGEIQILRTQDL